MTKLLHDCPHCNGKGTVPLKPESVRTLEVVRRLEKSTAEDIHKSLGEDIDISATHNRLARLVERGLVKKGRGRPHYFRVV